MAVHVAGSYIIRSMKTPHHTDTQYVYIGRYVTKHATGT